MIISRLTEAFLAMPFLITAIALGCVPRAEPHQCDDRDRFLRHADLHPADPRPDACGQDGRLRGRRSFDRPAQTPASSLRYILPNVFSPILVQATLTVAAAIIAEASLSFLGLGQQPPAPSWGSMLNVAKNFLSQAPWMAIWPGTAIFLVVMGFNLVGDGLRDALDPRET